MEKIENALWLYFKSIRKPQLPLIQDAISDAAHVRVAHLRTLLCEQNNQKFWKREMHRSFSIPYQAHPTNIYTSQGLLLNSQRRAMKTFFA